MKSNAAQTKGNVVTRRFVPSSFDPADPNLHALPRAGDEVWHSLAQLIPVAKVRGVMSRLPPFWQAMSPLHAACREHGVPLFLNDIANMPVGGLALTLRVVDAVVAEAADATQFAQHCADTGVPEPKLWLLVHQADATWKSLMPHTSGLVAHEVHVSPGIPVLEQCRHLAEANDLKFHQAGEDAPFEVIKEGTCPCGKTLVRRV